MADFVPDSFMRNVNNASNFYNVSNNFTTKMASVSGKYKEIVGLHKLF